MEIQEALRRICKFRHGPGRIKCINHVYDSVASAENDIEFIKKHNAQVAESGWGWILEPETYYPM